MNKTEKEVWKDVKGYEGLYQVSDLGRIRSIPRNGTSSFIKTLKYGKNKFGYLSVVLSKNGKQKNVRVHRLVAETFIPNFEKLPCVNHKNGIKTDNKVENLEWCTYKYNNIHAIKNNLRKSFKGKYNKTSHKILQINKYTNEVINVFYGTGEIKRKLGLQTSSISKCCRKVKNYNTAYGYKWEYDIRD